MSVEPHNVYQWVVSNKLTLNLQKQILYFFALMKNAFSFFLQYTLTIAEQIH